MANLLRQIVAGPRVRHSEANLDLCYVTDQIIATSGPSATWPQVAYRNPLDQLVKFLDSKHGNDWGIWEFRAEGTGYPDDQVYNRIWHYPWPDHHPPPFALIPNMMASMRNWLNEKKDRVVVVHCKAGKGRSGTATCSYLISECNWTAKDAMARFSEKRMRPGFGEGVSIPSQVRWIDYVERWAKHGKVYVENPLEIVEVQVWGLKDGVKVAIEGFVNEGKQIKVFHIFKKKERIQIGSEKETSESPDSIKPPQRTDSTFSSTTYDRGAEVGGSAVVFKPEKTIVVPTSDVNIDFERRNRATYGLTMVTSVAHVWFNAFFEGNGPESGKGDSSGVFEIPWEAIDGIKGSSRKGTKSFDKLAVVWKIFQGPGKEEKIIAEPAAGEEVPQAQPADWKGNNEVEPASKSLGIRTETPVTADVSKASSVHSKSSDNEKHESDGPERFLSSQDQIPPANTLPQPSPVAENIDVSKILSEPDTATSTTTNEPIERASDLEKATSEDAVKSLPGGRGISDLGTARDNIIGHMAFTTEPKGT